MKSVAGSASRPIEYRDVFPSTILNRRNHCRGLPRPRIALYHTRDPAVSAEEDLFERVSWLRAVALGVLGLPGVELGLSRRRQQCEVLSQQLELLSEATPNPRMVCSIVMRLFPTPIGESIGPSTSINSS